MGGDTAPHLPVGISTQFVKCVRCGVRTLREPQPLSDVCCPGYGPPSCPVPVTAAMQGIVAQLANLLRSTCRVFATAHPSATRFFTRWVRRTVRLLGCLWVVHLCVSDPYRLGLVVDAVPDSPARGDLVLPLLHLGSVPRSSTQRALSGCWRWSHRRGSWVILSQAVRVFVGAAAQICSHPLTAPLFA